MYRSLGTVCRVAASHGQQRRGERGTGGRGLEGPHQDLRPLYEPEHQEHNNKQRKCPYGAEEAGEHVAVLLLHRRVEAQLVYEKEDEVRRPEPAEANPQPEGRLVAPGERVRDSVRHAKRERGQDEVDEGGVSHEPVDSRMVLAGGALPQEHAHEEGEAIEGGEDYDDAKEARHELKRAGARLWRETGGEHGASLGLDLERARAK